jgi:hypothetical protein
LARRIAACFDSDLRRRLEALARENPQGIEEAMDWHDRLVHWAGSGSNGCPAKRR